MNLWELVGILAVAVTIVALLWHSQSRQRTCLYVLRRRGRVGFWFEVALGSEPGTEHTLKTDQYPPSSDSQLCLSCYTQNFLCTDQFPKCCTRTWSERQVDGVQENRQAEHQRFSHYSNRKLKRCSSLLWKQQTALGQTHNIVTIKDNTLLVVPWNQVINSSDNNHSPHPVPATEHATWKQQEYKRKTLPCVISLFKLNIVSLQISN